MPNKNCSVINKLKNVFCFTLFMCIFAVGSTEENTITLKDYTGRGFPVDLVNYIIKTPNDNGKSLRLSDAQEKPVAFQLSTAKEKGKSILSFVTSLPANQTVRYTLRDNNQGDIASSNVHATIENNMLTLSNSLLAIRIPAPMDRTTAVASNLLPAPILSFKSGDSDWIGGGKLTGIRTVKKITVEQTATGPVFVEAKYKLEYEDNGYYSVTIRIVDQLPFALITEEYDLKKPNTVDYWELNLTNGWSPDSVESLSFNRNGSQSTGSKSPISELKATPTPITSNYCIIAGCAWGPKSLFGVSNKNCVAGFAPIHNGLWRRPNAVEIQSDGKKNISLRLPIGVRPLSWLKEVTSEASPFSTHEHDSALSTTYGRRIWGLTLANTAMRSGGFGQCYDVRILYGTVGLDRYKDYILNWPDNKTEYPRVFVKKNELEGFKKAVPKSPLASILQHYYIISGNDADAKNNLGKFKNSINGYNKYFLESAFPGHGDNTQTIAVLGEDVLSWPGLSDTEREEVRTKLALFTYLIMDSDLQNRNSGSHNGTPNMILGSQGTMPLTAALIPDHPMYNKWRDWMAEFTAYKMGSNMAPGGGWIEFGSYHMHGYRPLYRGLMGLEAMEVKNLDVLNAYNRADWNYWLNLLTPVEPYWKARVIPGSSNSFPYYSGESYEGARTLAKSDSKLAANTLWAYSASGSNYYDANPNNPANSTGSTFINALMGNPRVIAKEPELGSGIYPGVGVVFRAHQGPDETYLYFRSGYNWSHWADDQGSMILYSKGAVLIPGQPYQYYSSENLSSKPADKVGFATLHINDVKFYHPENEYDYDWPDSNIIDHSFGPTVDYAWSSSGYPDWYLNDRKPGFEVHPKVVDGLNQVPGEFHWNRQIMFMKGKTGSSPNYFVIRDSTTGEGKPAGWLNLNLLGRKSSIEQNANKLTLNTSWPTKMDMIFTGQDNVNPEMREDEPRIQLFGVGPAPTNLGVKNTGYENHVLLRIPSKTAQGYFWVIYPRGKDEISPIVTLLADGVMKVETTEGTDYIFLSPAYFTYNKEGLLFEGFSGAIRVGKDSVTLISSGGSGVVGYKGYKISSQKAFEKTISLNDSNKSNLKIDAPVYAISYTAQLQNHKQLIPGVTKAVNDNKIEYLINSAIPVKIDDEKVHIEASKAAIFITPESVRVVALDSNFAQLSSGQYGARGTGAFDLIFTNNKVTGKIDGNTRTVVVTKPVDIVRAMYNMDGVRWYAGIADEGSNYEKMTTPQYNVALGVTDGLHQVEVKEWIFPAIPPTTPCAIIK